MASLTQIKQRFWNNDGTVAAGGFVYVYLAGTTTPTDSYTDATGSTPNTNPVVLDAKGEASIFTDRQVKINVLQSDLVQVTGYPMDYTGQVYANVAGSSSQTFSAAPATASTNVVTAGQIQAQSVKAFTTAGTSTAYTLTPSPAITAYATDQEFDVIFNAACGATPTINVNGLGAVNLVDRLVDGTYYNIPSGRIPINWRSKCVMISANQMLVRDTPCETVTVTVLAASAVSLTNNQVGNITSLAIPPGDWEIFGNVGLIPTATTVKKIVSGGISTANNTLNVQSQYLQTYFGSAGLTVGSATEDYLNLVPRIANIAVATTYYLNAYSLFSDSTMKGDGTISARRYK